ncbi:MAG: hypothetical protein PUA97_01000, partial [bacterium]|nr:hypothetical protein [bacterium]
MNDTTIIKAELCDFLSARTKNLANIQNMEDREVYISMVVDASNQIENLTSLFSQFEKVDEILGFNHMVVSNNNFVGETNENVNATGTTSDEVVSETVNGGPTEVPVDNTPVEVQTSSEKSFPDTAEKDAVEEEKVVIPLKKEESTGDKKDIVETASVDSNNIDVKTTPLPFINITTTQSNDSGKVDDTSNNMNNDATIPTTNPFISSSEESSSNDVIPQAPL